MKRAYVTKKAMEKIKDDIWRPVDKLTDNTLSLKLCGKCDQETSDKMDDFVSEYIIKKMENCFTPARNNDGFWLNRDALEDLEENIVPFLLSRSWGYGDEPVKKVFNGMPSDDIRRRHFEDFRDCLEEECQTVGYIHYWFFG